MADTVLSRFPIGQGKALPVDHVGPAVYTSGGETYGTANNQTGITTQGLATFDYIAGGAAISGNYYAFPRKTAAGEQKTWKIVYVTATNGIPTTTEVTNQNLSTETFPLLVIGR